MRSDVRTRDAAVAGKLHCSSRSETDDGKRGTHPGRHVARAVDVDGIHDSDHDPRAVDVDAGPLSSKWLTLVTCTSE
jgi:hypothetical protein